MRGLTTAAIVWITAAVGMACGAGLAIIALVVTGAHFIAVFAYPSLAAALPRSRYIFGVRVVYEDGRGILREVLEQSSQLGFSIARVQTHEFEHDIRGRPAVAVTLEVQGQPTVEPLIVGLNELAGVFEVASTDLGGSTD